jgi:hypothetical protein
MNSQIRRLLLMCYAAILIGAPVLLLARNDER